jgi:quercetin dioxygenase-like cupin family protein
MQPQIVATADLLAADEGHGPLWSATTEDLNVNLVAFPAGEGVPRHVNAEVDVLLLVVSGEGEVEVDGVAHRVGAGQLCLIPKGASRAIRALDGRFAYVTCHRRRGGLMPA